MRNPTRQHLRLAVLAVLLVSGCIEQSTRHTPTTKPKAELQEIFHGKRIVPQPSVATLLADGNLPLIYQFGLGGRVKVYDATARTQVWSATVPPDSIILVNNTGVLVKGVRALSLPLDPRHRFEMWYEP